MNKHVLTPVVILACFSFTVSKSYAWNLPPIAVISGDDPRYVPLDKTVHFYGTNSYDPDGGSIQAYSWVFDRFSSAYDKSGVDTVHMSCRFASLGEDGVSLKVKDDEGTWSEYEHCTIQVVEVQMKLEKVGNTIIEAANTYSENTTIRVTAVDAATEQTCEWFDGTVYIAEDGTNIYSQHTDKGAYLPSSITFIPSRHHGVKDFVAKSLADPIGFNRPGDARIKTTNYDVYDADYLPVPQYTNDLGEVHVGKATGNVYDWFETRMKDIFQGATGDVATVLSKWSTYDDDLREDHYAQIADGNWDHQSPSAVTFNPFKGNTRLDTPGPAYCGGSVTVEHDHTHTVMHEARHCYQDYLSSQDLGQTDDIAGKPNNDDDQDWLVQTVPIGPTNYILDSTSSRSKCSGSDSFSGDDTYDNYASGGTRSISDNVIEKDAGEFAEEHD